ncbi:MAG: hypothetical protein ACRDYA_13295 [Egibacteraceae bacterium]
MRTKVGFALVTEDDPVCMAGGRLCHRPSISDSRGEDTDDLLRTAPAFVETAHAIV